MSRSPDTTWRDLRDGSGRLLGRYDPVRRLLEIGRRGSLTLFDLARYDERPERPAPIERPERLTDQDQAHGLPGSP